MRKTDISCNKQYAWIKLSIYDIYNFWKHGSWFQSVHQGNINFPNPHSRNTQAFVFTYRNNKKQLWVPSSSELTKTEAKNKDFLEIIQSMKRDIRQKKFTNSSKKKNIIYLEWKHYAVKPCKNAFRYIVNILEVLSLNKVSTIITPVILYT